MKKIALPLVLLFSFHILMAQNWAPINTTEKFCYETDTAGQISHVLWVDSVKAINDIEVLYLNKVAVLFSEEGLRYKFNESQFLLDTVLIYETGEWFFVDAYFMPDHDDFSIFPYASLGDSWNFTVSLIASISSINQLEIFGEMDSVKTIHISNGSEILLSKNYGIINWKNEYHLIGIEGRDLGVTILKFNKMFEKISMGDVVCYETYWSRIDMQFESHTFMNRYEILSIVKNLDSVVLNVEYNSKEIHDYGDTTLTNYLSGIKDLVFYKDESTEIYPNEVLNVVDEEWFPDEYIISRQGVHKWGGVKKTQFVYPRGWISVNVFYECEDLYPDIFCLPEDDDLELIEYSQDYGFPEISYRRFEHSSYSNLVGIIDNGDTLGTIYPVDIFVGQEEINPNFIAFIYPSPSKEKLHIKSSEMGKASWIIYGISGKMLQAGSMERISQDIIVQVAHLPKGIYIIELIIGEAIICKKFVKE